MGEASRRIKGTIVYMEMEEVYISMALRKQGEVCMMMMMMMMMALRI